MISKVPATPVNLSSYPFLRVFVAPWDGAESFALNVKAMLCHATRASQSSLPAPDQRAHPSFHKHGLPALDQEWG